MKFFIPLGFRYGKGKDSYSHVGIICGPYADDAEAKEAIGRLYPHKKTDQFLLFDGQLVSGTPALLEKPEHEKREPGNLDNYIKTDAGYTCRDCHATILAAKVAHPIHLKAMPGAGSGECQYEDVPYCPNCEKKPDFHGLPVSV